MLFVARGALAVAAASEGRSRCVEVWRGVHPESDWSRPAGSKSWKSKVGYEAARRIDPSLLEETPFTIRPLQEEVRKELERDASLLKARQKLDKYAEGDGGAGVGACDTLAPAPAGPQLAAATTP